MHLSPQRPYACSATLVLGLLLLAHDSSGTQTLDEPQTRLRALRTHHPRLDMERSTRLRALEYSVQARCPGYPHCKCGPGRFSAPCSYHCRRLPGKHTELETICASCPAGKYSESTSNSWCDFCPNGRFSTGSATSKLCDGACKPGRFGEQGERTEVCVRELCEMSVFCSGAPKCDE